MLAASVPAITLMLIYGGAVTASSVASRMSSGNVSTDAVTPSLTKNSPILERSPLVQSSEATGMRGPDSEKLNLNIGAGYTTALGSSKDEVNQKQAAFSSQLGQQLVQAYGSEEKAMQAVTAGITNTSSQSDAYRAAVAHGEDLIRGSSLSEQLKDEQKAMIGSGAALGASVGFKMLGNGATVSSSLTAQLAKEAGLTGTQSQELGEIIKLNAANSQESAAGFMTAVAKDSMDTGSDTFTKNVGLTDSDVLSRSAAELLSTSARFTASNQMQQAMGIVSNHSSETLPSQLRQHGLDDDVRGFMARYGSQGGENSLHKLANGYYNTIMANNPRGNADDAKLAAQTFAIADGRFLEGADEGLREQMALEGAQIFSRLSGLSSPDQTGYRANEGIGSEAARIVGGTRDRVESSVTGPDSSPAAVRDTVNSGIVGVRSRIDNTDVEADFQERRGAVEDTVSDNSNILSGHRGEILRERLTKTAESNASILDTVGLAHVPIGNVTAQTLRDHGIGHLAMGADNYAALRKNAGLTAGMKRDDFMNMPEQERSQEITSVHGKLSSSLQEMGLNKDIADYSAAMMMPQVIDNLYSNSGATLGMFGGSEHTRDDVISAANEASAGLRAEMHDKLQSGLLVATGDSQLADMAMQQIANAATVVTHSPTSEGAAIANQMVNNTMAAANFGGEGPGTGGGAAWYGSPKPSAPTVVNSEPSQTPPPKSNINNPLIQ